MKHIILKGTPEGIYNICADEHPARGIFYPQRARQVGAQEASFIWGDEPERYVSNEKIKRKRDILSYIPIHYFFHEAIDASFIRI